MTGSERVEILLKLASELRRSGELVASDLLIAVARKICARGFVEESGMDLYECSSSVNQKKLRRAIHLLHSEIELLTSTLTDLHVWQLSCSIETLSELVSHARERHALLVKRLEEEGRRSLDLLTPAYCTALGAEEGVRTNGSHCSISHETTLDTRSPCPGWIIDVLTDLHQFSTKNSLDMVTSHLADTISCLTHNQIN
ncbi:hypothetical protein AAD018_009900 [Aestuariibius insulae]|uniref:hypothetical protein n=1 Tax=Aestuariibius insulae TaxID=2058287 RepID=UPI00345E1C52